jgi:hypothetical protein
MAQQVQSPAATASATETAKASSWSIGRIVGVAAAVLGGIIVLLFVVGLLFALFSDVDATASRIQIIRDIFIIMMALEFILIIAALAILILQIARLVNLVQTEVRPVLENTQEAVSNAKGTVEFVGKNVTQPVVKTSAFLAGAGVFIREVGGLRRAIRPNQKNKELESDK